mmetsp:Transcript_6472/g.18070  ORF Transcript_6472/g.18070 Transcript_6472/m.18070 type:complete len:189 (+) Transcript_6472:193-759(+)
MHVRIERLHSFVPSLALSNHHNHLTLLISLSLSLSLVSHYISPSNISFVSLTTPPAQELSAHPNASTECNGICKTKYHSTFFVPGHLDIQISVCISKLEKISAHAPGDACNRHGDGIANTGHESGEGETGKRLNEYCLVASLHAIEGVGVLVVAGSCIEIWILDVELFAGLHHGASHEACGDAWSGNA